MVVLSTQGQYDHTVATRDRLLANLAELEADVEVPASRAGRAGLACLRGVVDDLGAQLAEYLRSRGDGHGSVTSV